MAPDGCGHAMRALASCVHDGAPCAFLSWWWVLWGPVRIRACIAGGTSDGASCVGTSRVAGALRARCQQSTGLVAGVVRHVGLRASCHPLGRTRQPGDLAAPRVARRDRRVLFRGRRHGTWRQSGRYRHRRRLVFPADVGRPAARARSVPARSRHLCLAGDEEKTFTRTTQYAGRALIGWSWLIRERAFISTAAGMSVGNESGEDTTTPCGGALMATPVRRTRSDFESYVRVGLVFD